MQHCDAAVYLLAFAVYTIKKEDGYLTKIFGTDVGLIFFVTESSAITIYLLNNESGKLLHDFYD